MFKMATKLLTSDDQNQIVLLHKGIFLELVIFYYNS